jgi:hypothetical protein
MTKTLIVNEVLCFLSTRCDKLNKEEVIKSLLDNHDEDELVKAKRLLISECEKVQITTSIKSFTPSRNKNIKDKTVRDLFDIWQIVDREKGGQLNIQFVAADLNKVCSADAEKLDLQSLLKEILSLKEIIQKQNLAILEIKEKVSQNECCCKSVKITDSQSQTLQTTPTATPHIREGVPTHSKKRKLSPSAKPYTPLAQALSTRKSPKSIEVVSFIPATASSVCKAAEPTSVKTKLSFADKAETLAKDLRPWNLANALKNRKVTSITGKASASALKGVKPVTRDYWDLSVTRLALETTADLVKTTLQSHHIEVKDVQIFNSKIKGCKSAKVKVCLEHKDKVKNENVWPEFVRIHDWIYKPKSVRPKKDDQ